MEAVSALQVLSYQSGIGLNTVISVAVGLAIAGVEVPRRFGLHAAVGTEVAPAVRPNALARRYAGVLVTSCLPEMAGLSLVGCTALGLRLLGDPGRFSDPATIQVWEHIKTEWPILMGADTLLGFQAMLRLLVLATVSCRAAAALRTGRSCDEVSGPLLGMASVLALGGMATRGVLCSRNNAYWLEGPLGFERSLACEAAMVPLLAAFAVATFRRTPLVATAVVGAATAWASNHYLNLAGDPSVDRLFILAHVLEILSAVAFLLTTIRAFGKTQKFHPSVAFTYVLMPLQQALACYYFLEVFLPYKPEIIGSGRPICILVLGNLLAFGMYLCAAALFIGSYLDVGRQPGQTQETVPEEAVVIHNAASPMASLGVSTAGLGADGNANDGHIFGVATQFLCPPQDGDVVAGAATEPAISGKEMSAEDGLALLKRGMLL